MHIHPNWQRRVSRKGLAADGLIRALKDRGLSQCGPRGLCQNGNEHSTADKTVEAYMHDDRSPKGPVKLSQEGKC